VPFQPAVAGRYNRRRASPLGSRCAEFQRHYGQLLTQYDNTVNPARTYFVHKDHLGSTRLLTKYPPPADPSQNAQYIQECDDYYPYGELDTSVCSPATATTTATHKFTGKERDSESWLDNFGARYNSSSLGRFMSPDPLLNSLKPNNPQTLNRYAYVRNNPLRFIDPTGECEEDVHRDLPTVLALAAGFDADTAAAIGNSTQGVDDDPKTSPFAGVEARRNFHFTSQERRDQLWASFETSGSTREPGTFLHAQQDSYSHPGYEPRIGHAPDKTYNDPAKANNMTWTYLWKVDGCRKSPGDQPQQ
jgi:RHS repeat-associated protein